MWVSKDWIILLLVLICFEIQEMIIEIKYKLIRNIFDGSLNNSLGIVQTIEFYEFYHKICFLNLN